MIEHEWNRHKQAQLPLTIVLIDVDFFKQYNDIWGHLAGDDCLKSIAQAIQESVRRPGDFAARYGGEEFAVILADTHHHGAEEVADQIQLRIRAINIPHPGSLSGSQLTVSIGTATVVPQHDGSLLSFLHSADVALYRAKANGRDQTVQITFEELGVQHVAAITAK